MRWRKSSRSGGNGGSCVEIAHTRRAVRDSKNPGPILTVDVDTFLAAIRTGRLG
jgi:uncharacterized protein DUF397